MRQFLNNIAALFKVKTLVTLAVTTVFVYLAVTGNISSDNVMMIVTMVTSFYFGTQFEQSKGVDKL